MTFMRRVGPRRRTMSSAGRTKIPSLRANSSGRALIISATHALRQPQRPRPQFLFRHCGPRRFSEGPVLSLPVSLASRFSDGAYPAELELAGSRRPNHACLRLYLRRLGGTVPERQIAWQENEGAV